MNEYQIGLECHRIFLTRLLSDECLAAATALLDTGIDINGLYSDGVAAPWTPLYYACYCGVGDYRFAAFKLLLERGADPNIPVEHNHTALIIASQTPDAVALLIQHGADVNHVNDYGWTALHSAATRGAHKSIDLLLAAGADPTIKNANGLTAEELCRQEIEAQRDDDDPDAVIRPVYYNLDDLTKCLDLLRGGGSGTKSAVRETTKKTAGISQ